MVGVWIWGRLLAVGLDGGSAAGGGFRGGGMSGRLSAPLLGHEQGRLQVQQLLCNC